MELVAFIHVFIHIFKPLPLPTATRQHISNNADEALHVSSVLSDTLLSTAVTIGTI